MNYYVDKLYLIFMDSNNQLSLN